MSDGNLLSVREAARRLGVHENTVRNWCNSGVLAPMVLPGSGYRRIPVDQVEALVAAMAREWVRRGEQIR